MAQYQLDTTFAKEIAVRFKNLPNDGHPERPHGNGRQRCVWCERRAIAGFARGQGMCPYHWSEQSMGREWAERVYKSPGYPTP